MKRDTIIEETFNAVKRNEHASLKEVEEMVGKGYTGIPFVYKYAIVILGILAILAALAGVLMIFIDTDGKRSIPESLVAIGSASVGALVGIFAPVPEDEGKS